jgi:hypothetical protein
LLLLPSRAMVEQDWTPSKITQEHLQNLVSQGFMTAAKLAVVGFTTGYESKGAHGCEK